VAATRLYAVPIQPSAFSLCPSFLTGLLFLICEEQLMMLELVLQFSGRNHV
jgi:hypothetical protein